MFRPTLIFALTVCLLAPAAAPADAGAQDRTTVSGRVIDRETKQPLPAFVMVEGGSGSSADKDGRFRLPVSAGSSLPVKLTVFLSGFKKVVIPAKPGEPVTVELDLEPLAAHEVTVSAESRVTDEKNPRTVSLRKMEIYRMPGAAADPLYAGQALPGVNSLPDSSSLLIRGGAPSEVGYYLDGIEVRHPFLSESLHESYFSIFDNQVVDGFSIATTGVHPKYGDILSGVMDIAVKDGAARTEGGLGLSVLGLNGYAGIPLKGVGSFVGSFSRQLSDVFTWLNGDEGHEFRTAQAFGKFNLKLGRRHEVRLYGLWDRYTYVQSGTFDVGSTSSLAGATWTATVGKSFVVKALVARTDFLSEYSEVAGFRAERRDDDWQGRVDAAWDRGRHFLEFGAEATGRRASGKVVSEDEKEYALDGTRAGFYMNDKFRLTDHLFVTAGGRVSRLAAAGEARTCFDPRFSIARLWGKGDVLRFSAGVYHQFLDFETLRTNSGLGPMTAYHAALSFDRIREKVEFRATAYDKEYHGLAWTDASGRSTNEGYGFARGAELFVKLKGGRLEFIGVYNFLTSKRKEGIVPGLVPSPYDIEHAATGILMWTFKGGALSLRYSIATGRPYTPLVDKIWDPESGAYTLVWGEPFSARYPFYQRLDLSGNKNFVIAKHHVVLYYGITNILNTRNILRADYSAAGERVEQQSIFGRTLFAGGYVLF
jgi:hypothetical protein